jgi:hypothetical protein
VIRFHETHQQIPVALCTVQVFSAFPFSSASWLRPKNKNLHRFAVKVFVEVGGGSNLLPFLFKNK